MSFWDEIKNFAKPYNDDEDYDDYDDEMDDTFEEEAAPAERAPRFGRREAAPAQEPAFAPAMSTTTAFTPAASTGFSGQVVNTSNKVQLILVRPESFNDAPTIAANMRAKKAVVLNLEGVEKNLARRIVDFLSGCGYALDGSVKKVSQSTYVFCPHNMEVLGDLKNLQGEVENYV